MMWVRARSFNSGRHYAVDAGGGRRRWGIGRRRRRRDCRSRRWGVGRRRRRRVCGSGRRSWGNSGRRRACGSRRRSWGNSGRWRACGSRRDCRSRRWGVGRRGRWRVCGSGRRSWGNSGSGRRSWRVCGRVGWSIGRRWRRRIGRCRSRRGRRSHRRIVNVHRPSVIVASMIVRWRPYRNRIPVNRHRRAELIPVAAVAGAQLRSLRRGCPAVRGLLEYVGVPLVVPLSRRARRNSIAADGDGRAEAVVVRAAVRRQLRPARR